MSSLTPSHSPATQPKAGTHPMIGIFAVLIGSIISTLAGRLTSFGLADIRGAVHAGFDEGAWISTVFTVSQMLMGPLTVWLGATFGPRRVLLVSATVFTAACIMLPLSPDLPTFIALYAVVGLSSGTFVPLTLSFVLRNLPAGLAVYGVAVYAMNSELSQNISASIEGWYADHWSWQWIFWQNAFITPLMALCVWFGMPREPIKYGNLRSTDWMGLFYAGVGFSLLYAALDQGNRLDWLHSGLICGLLLAGVILVVAFVVHELTAEQPLINLRFVVTGNVPILAVVLIMFRFVILSTALIVPQYLTTIQGFRGLQTGDVLLWVALPQFALAPLIAMTLRHVDARIPLALGFSLIGIACFMASGLTRDWQSDDFLASQIVQAIGQSFGFTSLIWFMSQHLSPREALTFGAFVQTIRLFGGELGVAFMQTFLRIREQIHSYLVGLHVTSGSYLTESRLGGYSAAVAHRSSGQTEAQARATGLLARAVQTQANVLSYIDGFTVIGISTVGCLLLIIMLRPAPQERAG
ncbi:drug resistance transporter, EmrB/QacA subfamily [Paraburkholderia steynii]|uniref:Drug resistance transporter, EmrB/QacA subfamily n=1 Tax=Paraburkholderia steynii TaxID=1245441 RepID=A0A7Z7FJK6_9BURK|nr:MFS transporter [Paraburkholderia steynii]SDI57295.1 drug resistance transporter, EmrB/QacA subfamily [Paraburkholderia steynii]